tara:strand:- start:39067 stop:39603 length:537 start_codon:yes stop_codon:yes gene_type:complete
MNIKENTTIQFIYQDTQIHFLINPSDDNVMVNATEMAKLFNRRTKDFLKTDSTKRYIKHREQALIRAQSNIKLIENKGHVGIYFERKLALKFAMWLDVVFEDWVLDSIDKILFGNYKKHWDAHVLQLEAEKNKKFYKAELYKNLTRDNLNKYFEADDKINAARKAKRKAIANQLKMEL